MAIRLTSFDLNLLVAFDAIITERQVSRAADRVGLSQPAMSRILQRLRETFEDQLFIKSAHGMIPTPKALELHRELSPHLNGIGTALSGAVPFEPSRSTRRFVLGMPDMATSTALPAILRRLRVVAPGIDLTIVHTGNKDGPAKLIAGEIELALGVYPELPAHISSRNLTDLHEVCIGDRSNPGLRAKTLTTERFLSMPHVAVSVNEDPGTPIDAILATLGRERRVVVRTPHFMALPRLVLGTDLVAVFPQEFLRLAPDWRSLTVRPIPLPVPTVTAKMIWHRRADEDAGLAWLRDFIAEPYASA